MNLSQYAITLPGGGTAYNVPVTLGAGENAHNLLQQYNVPMNYFSYGNNNSATPDQVPQGGTFYVRVGDETTASSILNRTGTPNTSAARPTIQDGTSTVVPAGNTGATDFTNTGPNATLNAKNATKVNQGSTPSTVGAVTGQDGVTTPVGASTTVPQGNKNIFNPTTGQYGYQVPGQPIPAGWQAVGTQSSAPAGNEISVDANGQVQGRPTTGVGSDAQTQSILNSTPGQPLSQNSTAQTGQTNTTTTDNGKTPLQNVVDTYTQVYQQLGLGDVKAELQKTIDDQKAVTDELNGKISDINENPWLSQGVRDQKIQQLKDRYQTKLDTLSNYQKLYDSMYQQGQQEAQFLVGHIETDTQNAMDLAEKRQEALDALAKDNQVVSVGGREVLVNKSTGKQVADLGPTTSTTGGDSVLSVSDATLLGVPYGTTKTQAVGLGVTPLKPTTDAQNSAAGYAVRIQQSNDAIANAQTKILAMSPAEFGLQKLLPSFAQNADYQAYDQASKNFINAVLRRESGAAIAQSEFDNAYQQYLPKPGDSQQTLAQKTQNRATALASLQNASGSAYQNVSNASNNQSNASTYTTPDGKIYTIGADGKYYAQ